MTGELQKFLEGINLKKEEMWKQLYAEYYSPLCCYALKILREREQAADVVQGVIAKLWESDVCFQDLPSFRGYLYKSVYHNCLQVLRNKNVEDAYLDKKDKDEDFTDPGFLSALIEEEVVRRLRHLIQQLPGKKREVMLLCLEEKKVEEISKMLGISINTVKKHKKEAYRYIREMLRSDILLLFFLYIKKRNL